MSKWSLSLEFPGSHTASYRLPGEAIQNAKRAVQYGTDSLCAESGEQQRKTQRKQQTCAKRYLR